MLTEREEEGELAVWLPRILDTAFFFFLSVLLRLVGKSGVGGGDRSWIQGVLATAAVGLVSGMAT